MTAIIDRKVHEEELEYLGPVAIAMFIDAGWIRLWPMSWTRWGLHALQQGYGIWTGTAQALPKVRSGHELHERPDAAACWDRRRTRLPVGTNIPLCR